MSKKQELIDGLNDDLNLELEAVLRHVYHAATATGLLGHELREILKADLQGELAHAAFLADKIAALEGEVQIDVKMPKKLKRAKEMLEAEVAAERKLVTSYAQRIKQAEEAGDPGLVIHLEGILSEETDHAEELERLAR
ncbi:MAG TPA: ferritin-like domain-containing protein [Gemmatimonadales bacterium]|nr:ferritin-like domain-containing protein [Gemmatimonadales bacterium]